MTASSPPVGRTLRGLLEDADGRPLSGARIAFDGGPGEAQTGPDGSFSLPEPASGAPAIAVVTERGRASRVWVPTLEGERVRVVAVPPDGVPLRVLTPGTAPVPTRTGWMALLRGADGRLAEGPSGESSAARFAVPGLGPGTYALVVWAGPFLPVVVEPVVVDGRVGHALVTVEVARRGASVAGLVRAAAGAPRPACRITAKPEGRALALPARRVACRSDEGGRWRLEGLPAGRYVLVAEAEDGATATVAVDLLEREERALDLAVG